MSSLPLSIIDRIAYANGVYNYRAEADEIKYIIYGLTLQTMFDMLVNLQIPKESLKELVEGLSQIIEGFYTLLANATINEIDLNLVMPTLFEANGHLLAALTILEERRVRNADYFTSLQFCRQKMFEALALLQ